MRRNPHLPHPTVYEPFGYASGKAALGEDGGVGFTAAWAAGSYNASASDNFLIAPGSLVYPGLAVFGGHLYANVPSTIAGLVRTLARPIGRSGTTRYLSFLVRPEGVLDEGRYSGFFGLMLGAANYDFFFAGKPGAGQLDSYVIEDVGDSGQVPSTTAAVVGQVALLVVKMEFADDMDRLTLYVNPQVGAPEPAAGIVKQDHSFSTLDTVELYSTGAFSLDEIRIGETFESVTPRAP
jgi:hypothetical protein